MIYILLVSMITQGFITREGLLELNNYHYKPGGWTWVDKKMNPYWEFVVSLLPMWVAPNAITFIGWLFVIFSYANMLRYDYTLQKDIPSSCFFFAAFCLHLYSTLDAIDGKQARRTKSGSALGQLFDHGCDSFSITFFMLAICQATKLERDEVLLIFTACQLTFWTANWMEYNTGILQTNVGQFGVTQGQYTCVIIHLITGFFGQNCWKIQMSSFIPSSLVPLVPHLDQFITLNIGTVVVYFFAYLLLGMVAYSFLKTIWTSPNKSKVVFEFTSLFLIIAMEALWVRFPFYQKYSGMVLTNFGLIISLLIAKLIVSSVTKMKFPYFHFEIIPFLISTVVMYVFSLQAFQQGQIITFWACLGVNIILIFKFLHSTVRQLTSFLNIHCFSLKKRYDLTGNQDSSQTKNK